MTMLGSLDAKRERLLNLLREAGSVVVAYSGGVDSTVAAKAAHVALGDLAVAITADSPSVPRSELANARRVAELIGIRHIVAKTHEFDDPDYLRNGGDRCYYCKSELYTRIETLLPELGIETICSGANLDDLGDYRPGLTAAAEHRIRHPLQEAGLSKADVRELARFWRLPVADKPASPCLSSRLAPGLSVTPERLLRVEKAEEHLRTLGASDCRVRYHEGDLARIELPSDELDTFLEPRMRAELKATLLGLGFQFVTIDLEGLRSGSMNVLVDVTMRKSYATAGAKSGGG